MRIYTNFHQLWELVDMMFFVLVVCSCFLVRVNNETYCIFFSNTVKNIFWEKNLDSQENVDIYNNFFFWKLYKYLNNGNIEFIAASLLYNFFFNVNKAICSQFKCHI